jgi:hypothetical protein
MTQSNRPRPHTTTPSQASRRRSPRPERRPGQARTVGLVSEAVVARYIHDISQRRRPGSTEVRP